MAETVVGIRLALRGQRDTQRGLKDTSDATKRVGTESRSAGRMALNASRGFAAMADRGITAGIRGTASAVKGLSGTLGRGLVSGATAAGVAVGGIAVGLGVLGVKSVQAATDAGETGAAFGTVYGDAASAAQSWIDTQTKAYGMNSAELQQALVGFGGLGKQVGLTGKDLAAFGTDLTGAALDLGSFWNTSSEDTLAAIQSGLTGEAEPLKAYGIFMSDASLNAYAMAEGIGKTTDKMSEQEKIALRQMFILDNLGDAQGDLERTSGGLANQQRALSGRWLTAKQVLGKALTPAAEGLTKALNTGLTQAIDWMTPRMDHLSSAAAEVGRKFVYAGGQVPGLLGAIRAGDTAGIAKILDNIGGAQGAAAGPIANTLDTIVAKGKEVAAVGPAVTAGFAAMPISPLKLLGGALSWASQNAGLVRGALSVLLPIWGAYRVIALTTTAITTASAVASGFLAGAKGRETAGIVASTAASRAYAAGTGIATAAQWLWNAAMSANPIGLVVIGIVALIAGVVLAYKKFKGFRDVIGWAWDKLKGFWDLAKSAGKFIGAIFGGGGFSDDDGGDPPGRAIGGNVRAGQPYVVGERRRELFVPQVNGTIVPRVPGDSGSQDDDGPLAGAPAAPQRPIQVQLMLNGRELSNAVIEDFRKQTARA